MSEIRIPITHPKHTMLMGEFYGLARAAVSLEEAPEVLGKMPGFVAARQLIAGAIGEMRARVLVRMLPVIAGAGFDLTRYTVKSFEKDAVILVPIAELDIGDEDAPPAAPKPEGE